MHNEHYISQHYLKSASKKMTVFPVNCCTLSKDTGIPPVPDSNQSSNPSQSIFIHLSQIKSIPFHSNPSQSIFIIAKTTEKTSPFVALEKLSMATTLKKWLKTLLPILKCAMTKYQRYSVQWIMIRVIFD